MATPAVQVRNAEDTHTGIRAESALGIRYVARQPIFDLRGRVHGYELLFREGPDLNFCGDGDRATRTMIDNAVIFGLENLTGGAPAFVNCTLESLTENLVDILPPSMTVLEILETIEPTQPLLDACRRQKMAGFRIALDDFSWAPKFTPLIDLADYIKVDFLSSDAVTRQELFLHLKGKAIALVAEKVETQEAYEQACAEGFSLFQGFYFCRPVLFKNRKIPANHLFHLQILQQLHSKPFDLHQISELVKRDVSLTYRLMRLVNSPACAMRQEVRSIETAILAVGEDVFRRIATLAITSEMNVGQMPEVLRIALVRARFCELAAERCSLDATEQYLLGMLSLLPAMLRVPMEELVTTLPLRESIRKALLGTPNKDRNLLLWLELHEHGDWVRSDEVVRSLALSENDLVTYYSEAMLWADEALPK